MSLKGSCNCGAITVTIEKPGVTAYCHCTNCRNQSGARGSYIMGVPDADYNIQGTPKIYEDKKTDSGNTVYRHFCGDCGSPIVSKTDAAPGQGYMKLGLFPSISKPVVEVYTKNRDEWEPPIVGAAQIEGAPGH